MNKKTLFLIVAFILIAGIIYVLGSKNDVRESITINVNTSYAMMSIDDLITESDLIVIGNVNDVYASRWNTPDGRRPGGNAPQKITPDNIIFTDMDFKVAELIKGEQKIARIRSLGGVADGDRMIADNLIPETNKTYLLFLYLDTVGSTATILPGHYWITGTGYQGLYEIVGDRAISASDEWALNDLIAYIEKMLSGEVLSPNPTPIELSIETPTLSPVLIETSSPAVTFTELPTETPTELPTETAAP